MRAKAIKNGQCFIKIPKEFAFSMGHEFGDFIVTYTWQASLPR